MCKIKDKNLVITLSNNYCHKIKHGENLDTTTILNRMVQYLSDVSSTVNFNHGYTASIMVLVTQHNMALLLHAKKGHNSSPLINLVLKILIINLSSIRSTDQDAGEVCLHASPRGKHCYHIA